MSEFRHDPTTDSWVIIAPERHDRPNDGQSRSEQDSSLPSFDPNCPFCPGNESVLPPIIAESQSNQPPGWRCRVVPNRFPALGRAGASCAHDPFYRTAVGRGYHEVIIESPRHDDDLTTMPPDHLRNVIEAYGARYHALMADEAVQSVILFRNSGRGAGASLRHPHSQVIASEMAPPLVCKRQSAMRSYYSERARCVLCDIIAHEQAEGSRVVQENEGFLTFVPFCAAAPCEIWIAPKRHQAGFGEIEIGEIDLLASALCDALARLGAARRGASYNYMIDTAPKGESGSEYMHWRLRIVPQAPSGGFEMASGVPINPSLPEQDAGALRALASRS